MAKFKFPIHLPDSIREKFPKFQKNGGKKNWKKLTRKQKGIRIGAGIAVILVGGMIIFTMGKGKKASTEASGQRTATVQRMDITFLSFFLRYVISKGYLQHHFSGFR